MPHFTHLYLRGYDLFWVYLPAVYKILPPGNKQLIWPIFYNDSSCSVSTTRHKYNTTKLRPLSQTNKPKNFKPIPFFFCFILFCAPLQFIAMWGLISWSCFSCCSSSLIFFFYPQAKQKNGIGMCRHNALLSAHLQSMAMFFFCGFFCFF